MALFLECLFCARKNLRPLFCAAGEKFKIKNPGGFAQKNIAQISGRGIMSGMKKIFNVAMLGAAAAALCACGLIEESIADKSGQSQWEFGLDLAFLEKYADCVVLGEGESFVAVSPKLQARVMTSTLGGEEGMSIGWINRGLIASKNPESHMNLYGGEDRFWIGPEGTEHSVFFERARCLCPTTGKSRRKFRRSPGR